MLYLVNKKVIIIFKKNSKKIKTSYNNSLLKIL